MVFFEYMYIIVIEFFGWVLLRRFYKIEVFLKIYGKYCFVVFLEIDFIV